MPIPTRVRTVRRILYRLTASHVRVVRRIRHCHGLRLKRYHLI